MKGDLGLGTWDHAQGEIALLERPLSRRDLQVRKPCSPVASPESPLPRPTPVFFLLAVRNLTHKPGRSALLFLGYGLGVSVMIVLLSIGEALITQARDEKLVGGGSVTVLPEGLDVEVMKTGGLGGLFFSIPNARF